MHRALESEADALIFDLEDAVVPGRKQHARELLREVLRIGPGTGPQRWVRINQLESEFYGADLACCEELDLTGLVLPTGEPTGDLGGCRIADSLYPLRYPLGQVCRA